MSPAGEIRGVRRSQNQTVPLSPVHQEIGLFRQHPQSKNWQMGEDVRPYYWRPGAWEPETVWHADVGYAPAACPSVREGPVLPPLAPQGPGRRPIPAPLLNRLDLQGRRFPLSLRP